MATDEISPDASGASIMALSSSLLNRAGGRPGGRMVRFGQQVAAAHMAWVTAQQFRSVWKQHRDRRPYVVSVPDTDTLYDAAMVWVLDTLPPVDRGAIEVRTVRASLAHEPIPDEDGDRRGPVQGPLLRLFFDGNRQQLVDIGGHDVLVQVHRPETGGGKAGDIMGATGLTTKVQFHCRDVAGREAVLGVLEDLRRAQLTTSRRAVLRVPTRWGDWQTHSNAAMRPANSVALPAGQMDALLGELRTFLDGEAAYARINQPWHIGALFEGPPGTGKTSTALSLAYELGLDVYALPLKDLGADTDLVQMLAKIQPRSLLLLEDIDVSHAATVRDDSQKGVSMSGLLNALDGAATPSGLVTVMTTNDVNALDEALIREGRADIRVKFDWIDDDQFLQLATYLIPGVWMAAGGHGFEGHQVTHAAVVSVVKPFLTRQRDLAAAAAALADWATGITGTAYAWQAELPGFRIPSSMS